VFISVLIDNKVVTPSILEEDYFSGFVVSWAGLDFEFVMVDFSVEEFEVGREEDGVVKRGAAGEE
jgi:hypothetical protein